MNALHSSADLLQHSNVSRDETVSRNETHSKSETHSKPKSRAPMLFALAIAVFGLVAMLIVDHGPWNRPHPQTAESNHITTGAAASAVGATVTPTSPRPQLEPTAPGPKPVQPPNPKTP
jgi:hypothetical protein